MQFLLLVLLMSVNGEKRVAFVGPKNQLASGNSVHLERSFWLDDSHAHQRAYLGRGSPTALFRELNLRLCANLNRAFSEI